MKKSFTDNSIQTISRIEKVLIRKDKQLVTIENALLEINDIVNKADFKTMFLELQKLNNNLHEEYMQLVEENKKLKEGK